MNIDFKTLASTTKIQPAYERDSDKVINKFWLELRLTATVRPIVFLAGDYNCKYWDKERRQVVETKLPWKRYIAHKPKLFINGKESYPEIPCPNVDIFSKTECVGCTFKDGGDKNYGVKDLNALNAIVLSYYHELPVLSKKEGTALVRDGKPIVRYEECTPINCNLCKSGNKATKFGMHLKFIVGKNHLDNLVALDSMARDACANCGTRVATLDDGTERCGYDEQWIDIQESCGQTRRLGLFDCVWMLKKTGEGTGTSIQPEGFKPLNKFTCRNKQPIDKVIAEAISTATDDKRADGLYDFDKEKIPQSSDEQAAKLNVANPFSNRDAAPAQAYPTGPSIPQNPGGISIPGIGNFSGFSLPRTNK
jgi:hypothetical protein